jgi:hypothetical protein
VSATDAIFVHDWPLFVLLKTGNVWPAAGWLSSSNVARIRPLFVCTDFAYVVQYARLQSPDGANNTDGPNAFAGVAITVVMSKATSTAGHSLFKILIDLLLEK